MSGKPNQAFGETARDKTPSNVAGDPWQRSPHPSLDRGWMAPKGFGLVIPEGISVTGRIVCTEPKEKE